MLTPASSGYAPVNGVETRYSELHGKGKLLVLLHGNFGTIEMFVTGAHGAGRGPEGDQSGQSCRAMAAPGPSAGR